MGFRISLGSYGNLITGPIHLGFIDLSFCPENMCISVQCSSSWEQQQNEHVKTVDIVPDHLAQWDGKTHLLKTSHTLGVGHRNVYLEQTRQFSP